MEAFNNTGCDMVTEAVVEHPVLSVTVTVYVPALKLDAVWVVFPEGVHK